MTLPITQKQITDRFDAATFKRGQQYAYLGRIVTDFLKLNKKNLTGYVQGSKRRPYVVEVLWNRNSEIGACMCTCPVYRDCKHAVALLLAAGAKFGFKSDGGETSENELSWSTKQWIESVTRRRQAEIVDPQNFMIYVLHTLDEMNPPRVIPLMFRTRKLQNGKLGKLTAINPHLVDENTSGITSEDLHIASLLETTYPVELGDIAFEWNGDSFLVDRALRKMIETGRCFFETHESPALSLGETRVGALEWIIDSDGTQRPVLQTESAEIHPLICSPLWYVNTRTNEAGPLTTPLPYETLTSFLDGPAIPPNEIALVINRFKEVDIDDSIPLPNETEAPEIITIEPIKKLILQSKIVGSSPTDVMLVRQGWALTALLPHALFSLDYGDVSFNLTSEQPSEIRKIVDKKIVRYPRNFAVEKEAKQQLLDAGLEALHSWFPNGEKIPYVPLRAASERQVGPYKWFRFMQKEIPELVKKGWKIEVDNSFTFKVVEAKEHWSVHATNDAQWWFGVEVGIEVDGKKLSLLPILVAALIQSDDVSGPEDLEKLNIDGKFHAPLPDGSYVALPFERVRELLTILRELFDRDATGKVEVDAATALELDGKVLTFSSTGRLYSMMKKLRDFRKIDTVEVPKGLNGTLRDYQKDGFRWLNFLSEFEVGGILADDMGLGKTIQTLCHILREKECGRLNNPALIVCPTSVLQNWVSESAKFAPGLKVLPLHGPHRAKLFSEISEHDIVLTTYPLLHRDRKHFLAQEWSTIVLDEAQYIRNPDTRSAQCAFKLKARYRICLTGTPVENNLHDLWSQFHFLMPGYLGDHKFFSEKFRQPIEKEGDVECQRALARRVRPFMIRRTKSEVAKELPAKTTMLESIEFQKSQRDLYETVRHTMHAAVQAAIMRKGFKKSHMIILEALLRLRQVCCDPRLVGTKFSKTSKESAKLTRLMEMLMQLVAENRKILVFSQFTSMLDLIKIELKRTHISYVELKGSTQDRAAPINQFQNGEASVFLISLKAGGTGLNLTAADTVIHYDPWWNPAVENQATDRAHRIGQKKPVFVYKLITRDTVEERIVDLQNRKSEIASGIFDPDRPASTPITPEDLDFLFRPMNETAPDDDSSVHYEKVEIVVQEEPLLLTVGAQDVTAATNVKVVKNVEVIETEEVSEDDENNEDPFIKALLKHGISPSEIAAGKFKR